MPDQRDAITRWLEHRFRGHAYKTTRILEGAYGLVWILESDMEHLSPRGFAVKTFRPDKAARGIPLEVRALFERELGLWIRCRHTGMS